MKAGTSCSSTAASTVSAIPGANRRAFFARSMQASSVNNIRNEERDNQMQPQHQHLRSFYSTTTALSASSSSSSTSLPLSAFDGYPPLTLPTGLSPSAMLEFKACPQSFLFQYIYKQRQPTSAALAKGSMVHSALERVFDLKPKERNLENLENLFRAAWGEKRNSTEYSSLFSSVNEERNWGMEGLALLKNYVTFENPQKMPSDPVKREMWVRGTLSRDEHITSSSSSKEASEEGDSDDYASLGNNTDVASKVNVRGIVDRLDLVRLASDNSIGMCITDYKTGKAPLLKYSNEVNERIMEEKFWQLKVYAILLLEMKKKKMSKAAAASATEYDTLAVEGVQLRLLKLMYLTNADNKAEASVFDLGETAEEREEVLQPVREEILEIWKEVCKLIAIGDPTKFSHCNRSFCYCHKCRANLTQT
jgi:RecB family exonuclease